MPVPTIRPAAAADGHDMLSLSQALMADDIPCSFWGLTPDRLRGWQADPARHIVIAQDQTLEGIACYVRGADYQQHLAEVSVAVAPWARRRGIARALLQHLETHAADAGILMLKALIWVQNQPSRTFFAGCGYAHRATLYAEFMSEQFGEIDDCVYYKRLSPPREP